MSIDKLKTKFFTGAWLTDVKHYFTKINEIIDYLNGDGKSGDGSYKVYIALLTQSGTNAPTAIVLKNTLDEVPQYSYDSTGYYYINTSEKFTENKTAIYFGPNGGTNSLGVSAVAVWEDSSNISLQTGNYQSDPSTITTVNGLLTNNTLEIRVYN
jgi:hypothetical protein